MSSSIKQLTPHLWTRQSRLFQMNSGIFASEGHALLVDPGMYPDEIDEVAAFVEEQGLIVDALVITHSHWDHILGPERFPGVRLIAQAGYAAAVEAERHDILRTVNGWIKKREVPRHRPFEIPAPVETFEREMRLRVGALDLLLRHAPGHAPDQLTIYHEESGALWAADMLSDIETAVPGHSLREYRRTLDEIRPMKIDALAPGHGAPTIDRIDIRDRLEEDIAYLAELQKRVEQAVSAGKKLHDAQAACADMTYRNAAENAIMHQFSVHRAFIELGGQVAPNEARWNPDYDHNAENE